jgi:hypothetical protein
MSVCLSNHSGILGWCRHSFQKTVFDRDFFTHTILLSVYLFFSCIQFSITASVQYLLVYLIFSVIYNFEHGYCYHTRGGFVLHQSNSTILAAASSLFTFLLSVIRTSSNHGGFVSLYTFNFSYIFLI